MSLPAPRWCPRCRRNVLTDRVRMNRGSLRQCHTCGARTSKREPKPLRRGRKPIWAKRVDVKAAGDLTPEQWQAIWDFYGGICAWCELRRATQQDHVHPISRGGKHTAGNIVPACEWCNAAKGSSTRWVLKRRHPFMPPLDVAGEPIPDVIPAEEIPEL